MTKRITVDEAIANFFSLLGEVEPGEEIEITRKGRSVARLSPVRGPQALKGKLTGVVKSNASEEELFSTGAVWNLPGTEGTEAEMADE